MPNDIPLVCFLDDLARALRTSRSTIKRLRRVNNFPIPEMPSIGARRPRWSGEAVRRFIETGETGRRLLKRVG
jgi:hypothetical protein